jgi:hypothetical protein
MKLIVYILYTILKHRKLKNDDSRKVKAPRKTGVGTTSGQKCRKPSV